MIMLSLFTLFLVMGIGSLMLIAASRTLPALMVWFAMFLISMLAIVPLSKAYAAAPADITDYFERGWDYGTCDAALNFVERGVDMEYPFHCIEVREGFTKLVANATTQQRAEIFRGATKGLCDLIEWYNGEEGEFVLTQPNQCKDVK